MRKTVPFQASNVVTYLYIVRSLVKMFIFPLVLLKTIITTTTTKGEEGEICPCPESMVK